jgi:2-hydroxycyclohexanecarboxyl-CoA dehydrogenase
MDVDLPVARSSDAEVHPVTEMIAPEANIQPLLVFIQAQCEPPAPNMKVQACLNLPAVDKHCGPVVCQGARAQSHVRDIDVCGFEAEPTLLFRMGRFIALAPQASQKGGEMLDQAFKSKVSLVTASTSGIGKATARLLGQAGAETVIVNGRNAEVGASVRSELSISYPNTRFLFIPADLNIPEQSNAMFDQIRSEIGRVDVLVHCGGAQVKPEFFTMIDPTTYRQQIDGHFTSFVECCRRTIPMMSSGGSIVAIASDAGKIATPAESLIGAMKAAVIMFVRTLALEVSRQGIRVNVLTPSLVANTKSYDRVMSGEAGRKIFEKASAKAKLGVPVPEDVAPLAVFLSSSYASKITGQAISVNGGISAA